MKKLFLSLVITIIFLADANAQEVGHYAGGALNIRDYIVPEAGFYAIAYNYFYTTKRLNDLKGNQINSLVTPGSDTLIKLDFDVNVYALAPTIVWVTKIEKLGIKYGAFISPNFLNASLNAVASTLRERGGSVKAGTFGNGDLMVQPLWFGKTMPHWDVSLAYAFYAPTGRYEIERDTLPIAGIIKMESSDNLGYGFWTHQLQAAGAWYPWTDMRMAVAGTVTYEINGMKKDFDLKPGQNLSFTWGISEYAPLSKDENWLLEIGIAGYDTWQISEDKGVDAVSGLDQVHGIGGQLGFTYMPWVLYLNFNGFYEFKAYDRTQGSSIGATLGIMF